LFLYIEILHQAPIYAEPEPTMYVEIMEHYRGQK